MKNSHLGTIEYLSKPRAHHKNWPGEPPQPSDQHVASHGRLIESGRVPFKFYNGWYPIRGCSFPGHEPKRGAGISAVRGEAFRFGRVDCDICDHLDTGTSAKPEDSGCKYFKCTPNSVAPTIAPGKPPAAPLAHCKRHVDKPWRYHDPTPWDSRNTMPKECPAHQSNWFRHQIDCENMLKKNRKHCAYMEHMKASQKEECRRLALEARQKAEVSKPCAQPVPTASQEEQPKESTSVSHDSNPNPTQTGPPPTDSTKTPVLQSQSPSKINMSADTTAERSTIKDDRAKLVPWQNNFKSTSVPTF